MISESEVQRILPSQGLIFAFVRHMYYASDAPLAYALGAGLALTAALAPDLNITVGSRVRPPIWVMNVGESGERKGAPIDKVIELLGTFDSDRLLPGVQSSGALVDALSEGSGQFLWVQSELGEFFTGSTAGHHRDTLRATLMSVYDGNPISNATRGRGTKHVAKPRLSILGGINPMILEDTTTDSDWINGFMNRWTVFLARRERTLPVPPVITGTEFHWTGLVRSLEIQMETAGKIGPCLGWTQAAEQLWNDLSPAMLTVETAGRRQKAGSVRAQNTALKAAILYSISCGQAFNKAWVAPDDGWFLDEPAILFGLEVGRMHTQSVNKLLTRIAANPFERDVRDLLDTFGPRQARMMTLGQIIKEIEPRRSKQDVEKVINTLLQSGELYRSDSYGGGPYYLMQAPPMDLETGMAKNFRLDENGEIVWV